MTIEDTDEITSELHGDDQDQPEIVESDTDAESDSSTETIDDSMSDSDAYAVPVSKEQLRKIIEGALLAAGQSLSIARMLDLFDPKVAPTKEEIAAALEEIEADCVDRGFELKEVGTGWRFQVRDGMAPWVNRLWDEKPQKYSRALLETLALIAYRQPITRGDIEEIRGVAVSSHIMKTLMERDWVKVVGHRDVPGRPSLYATTRVFLDYFNLKSLEELPSLSEIRDLDELNSVLNLGEEGLGERDTDLPDGTPTVEVVVDASEELEEFVDGEEAFEELTESAPQYTGSMFDEAGSDASVIADDEGFTATEEAEDTEQSNENNTDAVDAADEDSRKD